MNRHLRWAFLSVVAISLAFSQTEEEYRRFVAHIQTALELKDGAIVADVGTGESPEQALHISKAVGESGKVICVDIDEKALETLRAKVSVDGLKNVETRLGKPDDPLLPARSVDAVLIAFAYHHFSEPAAMLKHIRTALRPEGRLVVIEAISEKNRALSREGQIRDHELSSELLSAELRAAGFEIPNGAQTLVENGGVRRYLVSARVRDQCGHPYHGRLVGKNGYQRETDGNREHDGLLHHAPELPGPVFATEAALPGGHPRRGSERRRGPEARESDPEHRRAVSRGGRLPESPRREAHTARGQVSEGGTEAKRLSRTRRRSSGTMMARPIQF